MTRHTEPRRFRIVLQARRDHTCAVCGKAISRDEPHKVFAYPGTNKDGRAHSVCDLGTTAKRLNHGND